MKNKWVWIISGLIVLSIVVCSLARAEGLSLKDTLSKIPPLKQGLAYSITDSKFSYLSTIELARWKGITAEIGYSSEDKAVGVISYELLKLKDFGVTLPILDLVSFNPGVFFGWGRINTREIDTAESTFGFSATLISIKW